MEAEEFAEGWDAFKNGIDLEDNPYGNAHPWNGSACDWEEGWVKAALDAV